MTAFLSRLIVDVRSREVQRDLADVQRLHRRVMTGFPEVGESARKALGVLFRVESGPGGTTFLVQSRAEPDWGRVPEGYLATDWFGGTPSVAVTRLDRLLEHCVEGAELRFRLRANPTRCIDSKSGPDGERRRGKRVPLRNEASREAWLRRKAEAGGFVVRELRSTREDEAGSGSLDALQVERGIVRGKRAEGLVTLEGVVFEGALRVSDPGRFREAMLDGIGRGRAYGFGLLSVVPL